MLSEKEKEVVNAICNGQSNKEIASLLDISVNTVKTHIQHIYKKLNIHSRTELLIKRFKKELI